MKNRIYAIMWDCYGLEAVAEVPDPALATFAVLKNTKPPEVPNINMWALRARFNTQRHYEIYIVNATAEIDREDIVEMFDSDPQSAADTIRRLGQKFYSDRRVDHRIAIT
jgi:cellulose synthase/poly-beta-1,6-N-acetylglucosamine synthase-like glycosyltransferase